MKKIETAIRIFAIFISSLFKVSALILLPLIIYFIIYLSLNKPMDEFFKLPEWMFISIILYGVTLSDTISFIHKSEKNLVSLSLWEGIEEESQVMVYMGILGITISSVLLMFIIIGEYENLTMPSSFYFVEWFVFSFALVTSIVFEIMKKLVSRKKPEA
ncbi:MAG: hypothetical protein Q7J35_13540 [Candidatus Methanoperedens sp.]|nr:hypothetical protein [Candidatus Methanoperedens sp.]